MPPKLQKKDVVKGKGKSAASAPSSKKVAEQSKKLKEHTEGSELEVINPEECKCDSCDQKPTDYDRDSPEDKKVRVKLHHTKKEQCGKVFKLVAYSKECYGCFSIRRKHCKKNDTKSIMTQTEVDDDRKKNTEADDKYWDMRRDFVQGGGVQVCHPRRARDHNFKEQERLRR